MDRPDDQAGQRRVGRRVDLKGGKGDPEGEDQCAGGRRPVDRSAVDDLPLDLGRFGGGYGRVVEIRLGLRVAFGRVGTGHGLVTLRGREGKKSPGGGPAGALRGTSGATSARRLRDNTAPRRDAAVRAGPAPPSPARSAWPPNGPPPSCRGSRTSPWSSGRRPPPARPRG